MSEQNNKVAVVSAEVLTFALLAIRNAADRGAYKIDEFETISGLNKALNAALQSAFVPPSDPTTTAPATAPATE